MKTEPVIVSLVEGIAGRYPLSQEKEGRVRVVKDKELDICEDGHIVSMTAMISRARGVPRLM